MRFSRLAQLEEVCRTLLEAATYIQSSSSSLCQELIQNGTRMLEEMDTFLSQSRSDLKNSLPIEQLRQVRSAWHMPLPDNMTEQLEQLRCSLIENITVQVRAVFFAELGGKWDSMESVYQYMRNDPRYDPVVVLTPIFRAKQINGKTETEVIYEDYLSKMGIPFLNYWEYDPEQDCPELAFTCQPYESVTLPEFWAANIAKYTRLVYLPYFIPHIINSTNKISLCNMPIHQYAWKVAGASEKFAQYYAKYNLHHGANLMLTGIPKMDYAVQLKNAPCVIPEAWRTKIYGRIPILWNTWFDGIASSLDLLAQMIPWFADHQQFALIWRPHPMSKAVMKLNQPERFIKLENMMGIVSSSDNMILDEGADLRSSFLCSSALISDYSAMMTQYLLLDKPVLWVQIPGKSLVDKDVESYSNWIVNTDWMERASSCNDVITFIEQIARGEDPTHRSRLDTYLQDLPFADGKAAERICNTLWDALFTECFSNPD